MKGSTCNVSERGNCYAWAVLFMSMANGPLQCLHADCHQPLLIMTMGTFVKLWEATRLLH